MSEGSPEQLAGVKEGEVLAGKYRVERVLGAGGMGVVVAARHLQLDEKVALKFLRPEALDDTEAVVRFAREARAAVKIKSEHVARVIDVGALPNGAPYMVMEYLEGGDLAAWVQQRGAMPAEQAVEFVLQACVAVADAHALGIVHRDLKPANLFCVRRSDGQLSIKVLDFGISRLTERIGSGSSTMTARGMAFTMTSTLMGSPLYMSPEQMRSSRDVDHRTDIWALGIILFELTVGHAPFVADSVTELAIKVANEPTPDLRTFRPDTPSGLEVVVARCLEKEARRRYPNVEELARALLPFAPPRAKAFVDRISGIIQGAGLSASALPLPPASQPTAGTRSFTGTLPPFGRTTLGLSRPKTAIGAGVIGLAVFGTLAVVLWRKPSHEEGAPAVPNAPTSPAPAASPQARLIDIPAPAETVPEATRPSTMESPAAAIPTPRASSSAASTRRPKLPLRAPAAVATATDPAPTAGPKSAPPDAVCDPPYYFDARGNRVFKPECL